MSRHSIIDDPSIGERAAELREERLRTIAQCACRRSDDGATVDRSACPVHREPPPEPPCGLAAPSQHAPADDWAAARTEATARRLGSAIL